MVGQWLWRLVIRALIEWYRQQAITFSTVEYSSYVVAAAGKVIGESIIVQHCSKQKKKIGSEVLDRLRTVRARTGVSFLVARICVPPRIRVPT